MAFLTSNWGGPYGRDCSLNSTAFFGRRALAVTVDMHDNDEFDSDEEPDNRTSFVQTPRMFSPRPRPSNTIQGQYQSLTVKNQHKRV